MLITIQQLSTRLEWKLYTCTDVSAKVVTQFGAKLTRKMYVLNVEHNVLMPVGKHGNLLFGILLHRDLRVSLNANNIVTQ